eukprot:gene3391-2172_t
MLIPASRAKWMCPPSSVVRTIGLSCGSLRRARPITDASLTIEDLADIDNPTRQFMARAYNMTSRTFTELIINGLNSYLRNKVMKKIAASSFHSLLTDESQDIRRDPNYSLPLKCDTGEEQEYPSAIVHLDKLPGTTFSEKANAFLDSAVIRMKFPHTVRIIQLMRAMPLSTASVERIFSLMRLLKPH